MHEVLMWKKVETGEKRQEGVITQFETIRKEKTGGNRVNGTASFGKVMTRLGTRVTVTYTTDSHFASVKVSLC